jgi:hypothetical protein
VDARRIGGANAQVRTEHLYAQAGDVVLIIETDPDSTGVFLYTFLPSGFVGENWMPDINTAKAQATHNTSGFPDGISPWKPVPAEESDLIDFGKRLRENLD